MSRAGDIYRQVLGYIEGGAFAVFFSVAQYIIYFGVLVSATILLEVLTSVEPSFFIFNNAVGAFGALISLLTTLLIHAPIGLVMIAFGDNSVIDRAMQIIYLSGFSFIGHFFGMVFDVVFAPLFAIMNLLNVISSWILVSGATQTIDGQVVPTSCFTTTQGYRFPLYVVGDLILLSPIIDVLKTGLEAGLDVCVAMIIGQTAADAVGLGDSCANIALNDLPLLKQTYDNIVAIEETHLFPAQVFVNFFSVIENFLQIVFPSVSGTDLLKHVVFIDRLEFDASNVLIEGQGSKPFEGFINNRMETIFGCQYV